MVGVLYNDALRVMYAVHDGANKKASPPGRHQEPASKQRCTFSPTTFSSVQFKALALGIILFFFDHYIQSSRLC